MADCVFCRILDGRQPGSIVYRDDRCAVFLDIHPVNPGHLLIVPLSHAPYLADLDEDTVAHLMRIAHRMGAVLRASELRCEGINMFLADGTAAKHEVLHVHLHVFPRFAGDDYALRMPPTQKTPPDRAQLDATAAKIRRSMAAGLHRSEAE